MKICKKIAVYILVFVLSVSMFVSVMPKAQAYSTDYPNTWNNTGNAIEDLIGIAMTQVGYYGNTTTGTKYGAWYGDSFTYSQWCGMFVAWCANEAGIPTSIIHKTAKANNYRNSGTYHYKTDYTPQRGDLVLYNPMTGGYSGSYYWPDKNADGTYSESSHVAIVCSYDSSTGKIWVVHGNSTDDKVCYNSISVSSNAIQAFVTPPYSGTSSGPVSPVYDYVNGDGVRMRKGPGTDYDIVASYNTGTSVEVLDSATNDSGEVWYRVKVISSGATGYIRSDFITVINKVEEAPTTHYINGDNVRLRSGAGTSFDEVDKFDKGTKVELLGVYANSENSEEKWYNVKIISTGDEGFIRSDFIKIVTTDQTPYINDDNVNLRSSETSSSDSLGKYSSGTKVEILSTVKNSKGEEWNKVIVFSSQIQGYIRSDFITIDEAPAEPEYDYTNASYNLRSAPGTWNEVVGTVAANTRVYILEASYDTDGDKWFYVRVASSGVEGYIYHKRVNINSDQKDTVLASSSAVMSTPGGSTTLCTAKKGDTVNVLSITYDGKGTKWLKVKLSKSGTTYEGYIKAADVTLNGVNRKNVAFTYNLETPASGSQYDINDTVSVRGWAFSNVGEAPCFYSLDGGEKTPFTVEKRTDVKSSHSACTTDYAGFKASLSAEELSYGEHTLEIFASSDVTVQSIYKVSFNITDDKPPAGQLLDVTDIDDTGYTVMVSAEDNIGISSVYTSTTANGKTVQHIANSIDDGVYAVRVKVSDFGNSDTDYTTTIYVRDTYSNVITVGEIKINPARYETITVSFDANGGNSAPDAVTLAFDGKLTIPKTVPERKGYIFKGWSTEKDGKVEYKTGMNYTLTQSITLYAVWSDTVPGDCNRDGEITTADLAMLKLALCYDNATDLSLYDFNCDGTIDTKDLAELKLYLVGGN